MAQLSKTDAKIVKQTLDTWEKEKQLSSQDVSRLKDDITIIQFNWHRLARYCFWIAIISIIISITSLVADQAIQKLFKVIFDAPHAVKALSLVILAGALYGTGHYLQCKHPSKTLSAEALLFFGVLATAQAIYQAGLALGSDNANFSILLFTSFVIYALLGIFFRSKLIWIFALFSLAGWFGAETGYASGWGAYYLGMNFPLRFVLFGGALTALSFFMPHLKKISFLRDSTLIIGLLYLFIALWIMSIFGNHADIDAWANVKQIELFHWSLLFAIAAIAAIYHGIKYENNITKGFGLTFLFINLYTRFFEFFWNELHKGIFFAIIGISFWYFGSKAEKIWHLENMVKSSE